MTNPNETRRFEMQIQIAAPRDAVWQAIASDEGLRRWFAPEASVDAQVGGEIVWAWRDHHRWAQQIEILEPGARLRTRYDSRVDDGDGGKKPLFVDFLLEGEGGCTNLRLVQSGFGSESGFDQEYDGIRRGWPVELRSLRLYLEQHPGQERVLAWSSLEVDMDPGQAWQHLTGDEGFACGEAIDSMSEGQSFELTSPDGDVFRGHVLQCHAHEFSADLCNYDRAFFRLSVDDWDGKSLVWCWLAAYERDSAEMAALQERWDARLSRLFTARAESAPARGA